MGYNIYWDSGNDDDFYFAGKLHALCALELCEWVRWCTSQSDAVHAHAELLHD